MAAACEEMKMASLICPKPRRFSPNDNLRPFRRPLNNQVEIGDSKARANLLDIFLTKESYGEKLSNQVVASSPPFFCGSPPSRASNPIIQDEQFGNADQFFSAPPSPSSFSLAGKERGSVQMKVGQNPAPIRIEGFDCLSRDRQNCSISAVA